MDKELRLYCLVPYNLSPIQQGIQALHATVELGMKGNKDYKEWAKNHKTVIVLNGGTTGKKGSLQQHVKNLDRIGVDYAVFREPDLNNALSSVAFIVDMSDNLLVSYLNTMELA